MRETTDFKITTAHSPECGGYGWFFPNGWRGVGPLEERDRGGRLRGRREGYMPSWFVLMCNDPKCGGRAVVPVSVITDLADRRDPSVHRRSEGAGDE